MAHVSLYRRFRPVTWDKVIGQDHIVTTLVNQIKSGAIGHAYLFTGTRGTGKTSSAKIFARAVNCLAPNNGSPCGVCAHCAALSDPSNLDIIEMDAASNNGVDEIRELKENVLYPPAAVKYKVYIIDEVHMLSGPAFNALLKTLEEPPKHVIFILATTEAHKLPQTILSRCLRFDFRLVPQEKLAKLLGEIFDETGYAYEKEALELLAAHGEGSVRDTLSLADMCMSYAPGGLAAADVLEVLGASDFGTLAKIAEGVIRGQMGDVLSATNLIYARGRGISTLNRDLNAFFRDIIAIKNVPSYKGAYVAEQYAELKRLSELADNFRLGRAMDILASVENLIRYSTQPQIVLDACLVKAAELQTEPNIEALLSRVRTLETRIKELESGAVQIAAPAKPIIPPSAEPRLPGLEETLSKMSLKEDTAPVFGEATADAPSEPDSRAKAVMSGLLTAVREQGYTLLHKTLAAQEDYCIEDGVLTVKVSDAASWSLLSAGNFPELLKLLAKESSDGEYGIDLVRQSNKVEMRQESRNTLTELFGNKLVDKNRQ